MYVSWLHCDHCESKRYIPWYRSYLVTVLPVEPTGSSGGPGRTRTCDQGIHLSRTFLYGADYLITLSLATGGVREALACYQEH